MYVSNKLKKLKINFFPKNNLEIMFFLNLLVHSFHIFFMEKYYHYLFNNDQILWHSYLIFIKHLNSYF